MRRLWLRLRWPLLALVILAAVLALAYMLLFQFLSAGMLALLIILPHPPG